MTISIIFYYYHFVRFIFSNIYSMVFLPLCITYLNYFQNEQFVYLKIWMLAWPTDAKIGSEYTAWLNFIQFISMIEENLRILLRSHGFRKTVFNYGDPPHIFQPVNIEGWNYVIYLKNNFRMWWSFKDNKNLIRDIQFSCSYVWNAKSNFHCKQETLHFRNRNRKK